MVNAGSKIEEWLLPTTSMLTDGVFLVLEDALHRAIGGGLHGGVDLFGRDLGAQLGDEVGGRAVRHRHAEGDAVELALEIGDD